MYGKGKANEVAPTLPFLGICTVRRGANFTRQYRRVSAKFSGEAGNLRVARPLLSNAAAEDLGDCCGLPVKIQFSADFEQFGDADVAEFRPHAEVGDAESLDLARVAGVGVLLHDPRVCAAEEVVEWATTARPWITSSIC